jgi:hypothetical protein
MGRLDGKIAIITGGNSELDALQQNCSVKKAQKLLLHREERKNKKTVEESQKRWGNFSCYS